MFHMTPAASAEILESAARSDAVGMALRIGARPGDDGEIEIGMGFDEAREDDQAAEFHGLTVVIGAPSQAYLQDTVLDFVEIAPGQSGFVFLPTQAVQAEGCSSKPASSRGGCGSGGCGSCGA